jgi:hypothetical protein
MKPEPYSDALGIPSPSEESLKIFSRLIFDTIDQVNKRLKVIHHPVPDEPFDIIHLSFLLLPVDEWKSKFTHLIKVAFRFFTTPDIFWTTIAVGLYSPKVGEAYKKFNPSFNPEKYLTKTITISAPQRVRTRPTSTPSIGATLKKVISKIPKRRFPTVTEYILFRAPSKSYELIYSTTLGCCKNKRSSKGKKVYPYGQRYIEKLTGKPLRTVERAWSWLRKRGIFNKARNENPKEHHCALWYVCTSMKQVPYFRDPENRHRKSKRQD